MDEIKAFEGFGRQEIAYRFMSPLAKVNTLFVYVASRCGKVFQAVPQYFDPLYCKDTVFHLGVSFVST